MIKEALAKVVSGENLTYDEMRDIMDELMTGEADQLQAAAFLTALSQKGETIEEITAAADGMRAHGVHLNHEMDVLEIVGTGGDKSNSFNISTTSAFVISAAGVKVAKHGNRAASSKSGAADCLEALGVNLMADEAVSKKALDEVGMCFLFAQKYHPAMRFVGPIRGALGIRTVFNILGPLTNPANANRQVLGVYSKDLVEPMAKILANLGVQDAMVVYGEDGLDEISASASTYICEIRKDGDFRTYEITPETFGLERCTKEDLVGGTGKENAQITRDILSGKDKGPKRTAVLLNAGAAIYLAKDGISFEDGIKEAADMIDSGKAYEQIQKFVDATNA
ncbi:MAG: anthranilate phosphoribosyltransferase [Lachnospiraceae bacterium]|nr:anthranilate phosphoribosyltransferase [Lachnospiraceae bacterium]